MSFQQANVSVTGSPRSGKSTHVYREEFLPAMLAGDRAIFVRDLARTLGEPCAQAALPFPFPNPNIPDLRILPPPEEEQLGPEKKPVKGRS
jgi:hypothetical protein